jgi:hypothetical protein
VICGVDNEGVGATEERSHVVKMTMFTNTPEHVFVEARREKSVQSSSVCVEEPRVCHWMAQTKHTTILVTRRLRSFAFAYTAPTTLT